MQLREKRCSAIMQVWVLSSSSVFVVVVVAVFVVVVCLFLFFVVVFLGGVVFFLFFPCSHLCIIPGTRNNASACRTLCEFVCLCVSVSVFVC